jgi:hypothetical protein
LLAGENRRKRRPAGQTASLGAIVIDIIVISMENDFSRGKLQLKVADQEYFDGRYFKQ